MRVSMAWWWFHTISRWGGQCTLDFDWKDGKMGDRKCQKHWCDDKCLPPKMVCRGFESMNQPLQKKLGVKAAYPITLIIPCKSGNSVHWVWVFIEKYGERNDFCLASHVWLEGQRSRRVKMKKEYNFHLFGWQEFFYW